MDLITTFEIEKQLVNKQLKEIKFGYGNITLIFKDNTKLCIRSTEQRQLEIELEYLKKEHLLQILD